MQQYVNNGYWETTGGYPAGTRLKINPDHSVKFHNSLMAPGNIIIGWDSVHSYQATKIVPQLPILRNNHKYRLTIDAKEEPLYTLIIRLTFFDAQDYEISRIEFQQWTIDFTFPAEAVHYRLELINSGLTDLTFRHFQICDAELPVAVNEDVWIQPISNPKVEGRLNILLVADSIRVRKTYPELKKYEDYKTQVVNITWQLKADPVAVIRQWLINNRNYRVNVISTDPKLDPVVLKLKMEMPSITAVITNQVEPKSEIADIVYPLLPPTTWSSRAYVNPDWPLVFSVIQEINSKEG